MTDSASEKKITRQTKGQHISKTSQETETVIPLHSKKKGTSKLFELPITLRKYPKLLQTLKREKTGLSELFLTDVFQIKCTELLSMNLMVYASRRKISFHISNILSILKTKIN